jgi:hypothetical protein
MTTIATTPTPVPNFEHLLRMTDGRGTFEHALRSTPRPEHGYCTDDAARVLVVAAREPDPSAAVQHLAAVALQFVAEGQAPDGRVRNRVSRDGWWQDAPGVDDCWGRSMWGFGVAAVHGDADRRDRAVERFARAARWRSPWPRAMAYAAIGAAELFVARPGHRAARAVLEDVARGPSTPAHDVPWPWPEPRLTYANAVIPEAMIAAGSALGRQDLLDRGLSLLAWLLDHETRDGHLSVVPVGGAGVDDPRPAFDQQPVEVVAIAEACARAATVDGDPRWAAGVASAVAWFAGDNDASAVMWDPATGGGFDGLEAGGHNENQGAESTLAVLATHQLAQRLAEERL